MDTEMHEAHAEPDVERQVMEVDIACVGFGPAMGGFLTTLSRGLVDEEGNPVRESETMPGMPPQVVCYERADDLSFGVSGVVTRARGIKGSFPELDPSEIPMAAAVKEEKTLYLLDPIGASRRSAALRVADRTLRAMGRLVGLSHDALELPYTPEFLHKKDGLVLSLGQLNQWVAGNVMGTGLVQLWPGTPVSEALIEDERVVGVRLVDQGLDKKGNRGPGFTPGMDIRAALTVVADGPVGPVGRQMDERFGMPDDRERRDWALGMKMVVDLPEDVDLEPGTVFHTFGYPEPEIFGFFYVHPERVASVGIFVPSWFDSPARTAYRYLQHFMMHPYLWRYLEGGTLRSWGAKSLLESGRRAEPHLAGEGYARIGEGSGSTNVLTGSGVDEAWTTGVCLGEAVLELMAQNKPFTRENLEDSYVARRRKTFVESEGRIAERSRDGFQWGLIPGMVSMAIAGLTEGRLSFGREPDRPYKRIRKAETFYWPRLKRKEVARIRQECRESGKSVHDALMDACGWPTVEHDGQLLVTHQDALLMGGKVQAPDGYADHVVFLRPELCQDCGERVCIEMCSGQALTPGEEDGTPAFDREKCVHCGACLWNCSQAVDLTGRSNIDFRAGPGGLHSAEN